MYSCLFYQALFLFQTFRKSLIENASRKKKPLGAKIKTEKFLFTP
jgi:hypothetical protein